MIEKTLRALVEAGAIRRARIVAERARFHVEVDTATTTVVASTLKGAPKTWSTLDTAAGWVHNLALGRVQLDVSRWQRKQRDLAW